MPDPQNANSYEGLIAALARLDPAKQRDQGAGGVHDQVREALEAVFPYGQVADFECLGRYDAIYLVRVPDLVFHPIARMRYVEGLKKLDVQYAYLSTEEATSFWKAYKGGSVGPFALLSYLRVRDDFTYLTSGRFHEQAVRPTVERLLRDKQFPVTLLLRGLGWPDYLFLAAGENMEDIARFAQMELRGLRGQDILPEGRVEIEQVLTERGEAFPDHQPVFSRTYTVLGYPRAADLTAIKGQVRNLQIDVRLRPGADREFDEVPGNLLGGAGWPTGDSALQFGSEDAAVWLNPGNADGVTTEAGEFLRWCRDRFVPDLQSLATTTEVRLALPREGKADGLERLPEPPTVDKLKAPRGFLRETETSDDMLLAQPLAAALRRACGMINWAMVNEGVQRDFVDMYRQWGAFLEFVVAAMEDAHKAGVPDRRRVSAKLLSLVSLNVRLFSDAFSQRLAGSYYDLGADSPEVLIEYPGGIQKLIAALYGLVSPFLIATAELLNMDPVSPCCIVSREAEPADCCTLGDSFVFRLCSSLALAPQRAVYPLAHELGHMLRHLHLSRFVTLGEARWDEDTSRLWFNRDLANVQRCIGTWEGRGPWTSLHASVAGDVLTEVYADTMALLLLNGDYDAYQQAALRVLPRHDYPMVVAIGRWVMRRLAEAIRRRWGSELADGAALLDLLVRDGQIDVEGALRGIMVEEPLEATGDLSPLGKAEAESFFDKGWQRVRELRFDRPEFRGCLSDTVDYVQGLLREMAELCAKTLPETGECRARLDTLRRIQSSGSLGVDPAMLEKLWGKAMAEFVV